MPSYYIHDNGGRPFKVTIDGIRAIVRSTRTDIIVLETEYTQIWIGHNNHKHTYHNMYYEYPKQRGNSILLRAPSGTYFWIGWKILRLELNQHERVIEFDSPVGNNDVPYPVIFTNQRVILLIEEITLPINDMDPREDPYVQFYDERVAAVPFDYEIIVDRQMG